VLECPPVQFPHSQEEFTRPYAVAADLLFWGYMGHAVSAPRPIFVCADIGRGHPFYLDGLRQELGALLPPGVPLESHRAPDLSGPAGRLAWFAIRQMYLRGSSPGLWSGLYARLRRNNDYDRDTQALRVLRSALRAGVARAGRGPIVVSHPLLVAALRPHPCVIYQHGELVTPGEAVVLGAHRVLVPTPEAAAPFLAAGYDASTVCITGLCIEPELVAQAEVCFRDRVSRLDSGRSLTGAFFSSGAEPSPHVETLARALGSAVHSGGTADVFVSRGGRFAAVVTGQRKRMSGEESERVRLHSFDSRGELDRLTALQFHAFDYVVAPPHERSHWAIGLGLPMFLVGPDVGPFAPLNRRLLLDQGVARPLEDGPGFGASLAQWLAQGQLASMANLGWGRHSNLGFAQGARYVVDSLNSWQGDTP